MTSVLDTHDHPRPCRAGEYPDEQGAWERLLFVIHSAGLGPRVTAFQLAQELLGMNWEEANELSHGHTTVARSHRHTTEDTAAMQAAGE